MLNATYYCPQCIIISLNWFILQIIFRFYVYLLIKCGLNVQEVSNFNLLITREIYNFNQRLKFSQVLKVLNFLVLNFKWN